jgi:hypothetical protein
MSPVFEIVSRLVGAVINMLAPVIFGAVGSLLGAVGPMLESLTKGGLLGSLTGMIGPLMESLTGVLDSLFGSSA